MWVESHSVIISLSLLGRLSYFGQISSLNPSQTQPFFSIPMLKDHRSIFYMQFQHSRAQRSCLLPFTSFQLHYGQFSKTFPKAFPSQIRTRIDPNHCNSVQSNSDSISIRILRPNPGSKSTRFRAQSQSKSVSVSKTRPESTAQIYKSACFKRRFLPSNESSIFH